MKVQKKQKATASDGCARYFKIQKVLFYLILFSFFSASLHASPQRTTDSLIKALKAAQRDSVKVRILFALSDATRDTAVIESMNFAAEALNISRQSNWNEGVMLSLLKVGACYDMVRSYDEALASYRECSVLARSAANRRNLLKSILAISENYNSRNIQDTSYIYKLQVLDLARALHDTTIELTTLNSLGGFHLDLHHYTLAAYYWRQAAQLLKNSTRTNRMAMVLNNLSNAYIEAGYTDSAGTCLSEAYEIIRKTGDRRTESFILVSLCSYYMKIQSLDSAASYGLAALQLSRMPEGDKNITVEALRLLSEIYESEHAYMKALFYCRQYIKTRDSIHNDNQLAESARMIMKYNYERQLSDYQNERALLQKTSQRQWQAIVTGSIVIAVLILLAGIFFYSLLQIRRKNKTISTQAAQLKKQKASIQKALAEKEVLMKEIHHRVKNNLQVISALQQMQSNRIADQQVKSALEESQNRVLSIAFIHQNLYQHDDLSGVEMKSFIEELSSHIVSVYERFHISVAITQHVAPLFLDIDSAIPLGLIINELLTNSYKYAFEGRQKGIINISLADQGDGSYLFTYFDDGPGLPAQMDIKNVRTLGLKLIRQLSRQLDGTMEYSYYKGANFILLFSDLEKRNKKS